MAEKLTTKQQLFINCYLSNGFNQSLAALEAGYKTRQSGAENMSNPVIREEIQRRLTDYAMPANEVIARLADMARADMRELADISIETLGTHPRGNLIKKLKLDINYDHENKAHQFIESFELYDAQAALVQLAKVHGLLIDKTALTTPDGKEPFALEIKSIEYRAAIPSPTEE